MQDKIQYAHSAFIKGEQIDVGFSDSKKIVRYNGDAIDIGIIKKGLLKRKTS